MEPETVAEAARTAAAAVPTPRRAGEAVTIVTSSTSDSAVTGAADEGKPVRPAGPNPGQTIAAVERAIDVLLLFGRPGRSDLGVTEISAELGLSKAAVHRILTSLRTRDLVTLDSISHRYSLGSASLGLGRAYLDRLDVRAIAAPALVQLSSQLQETAILSIRAGDHHMYVEQVVPQREVRLEAPIGIPIPLHAGSCSKAFLAFLDNDEIENYLARPAFEALTSTTVTSAPHLRQELLRVRAQGYAISNGERQAGAASIAAPILDHSGRPAAVIALAGPAERMRDGRDAAIEPLLDAARHLSEQMGWSPISAD